MSDQAEVFTPGGVNGIAMFKEWFADFEDCYLLIGGTASYLLMAEAGREFRATKDFDIVLCAEALTPDFVTAFWGFIEAGAYRTRERGDSSREYFRFLDPVTSGFPHMLELFSRELDEIRVPEGAHLTPIPAGEEAASLSAILLDDTYYHWVMEGRRTAFGLPVVGVEHLIALKALAHLNLLERKASAGDVQGTDVKKHKNDVVRLLPLLPEEPIQGVPERVRHDIERFVSLVKMEDRAVRALSGRIFGTATDVIDTLRTVFALG